MTTLTIAKHRWLLGLVPLAVLIVLLALGDFSTVGREATPAFADSATIKVSGFANPRSRAPLINAAGNVPGGDFGTTNIVNDLQDPNKFGEDGIVPCAVQLLPHVQSVLPGSLVDGSGNLLIDVFFAGLTGTTLTAPEATEVAAFLNAGGVLYISGNSGGNEGPGYNPLFTALGVGDNYPGGTVSTGNFVQSSDPPDTTPITNGVFGTVGPLVHTPWGSINPVAMTGLATGFNSGQFILAEGAFGAGYLSATGDPLYFNFFTDVDPDNQRYFLNLFALGCGLAVNPSISLVNKPDCTTDGENVDGIIRIANTGSGGLVQVETVNVTIFSQLGGGDWNQADPQNFASNLGPGKVLGKTEEPVTFNYSANFTALAGATEYRSIVEVTLVGRADTFSDTRHFKHLDDLDGDPCAADTG